MTVYEQIQNAIDFMEMNLDHRINSEDAAARANMSLRSFYNYFQAITGHSFGGYLRKRRMGEALAALGGSSEKIINIALRSGYESHEAFSRAFRSEFGLSPIRFRNSRRNLKGLKKIIVIREMYMGVVVKKLPEMKAISFIGFAPNPEDKAVAQMEKWIETYNKDGKAPYRIFGHNIHRDGSLSSDPDNVGYKIHLAVDEHVIRKDNSAAAETIAAGTFVVTGIEGNFNGDEDGKWITAGWQNLQRMISDKGYKVKCPERCFEEVLEPSHPGNLRMDLYLEIE